MEKILIQIENIFDKKAPEILARTTGKNCEAAYEPVINSDAKKTPAIGALNVEETAEAAAQPSKILRSLPWIFNLSKIKLETPLAKCTIGPARPVAPPVPNVITLIKKEPIVVLSEIL